MYPVGDWCIACESLMRPLRVVVFLDELLDEPEKMPIIERNDVVQQLPPQRTEEAFHEWILPRTSVGSAYLADAAVFQKSRDSMAKDSIVVAEHESWL